MGVQRLEHAELRVADLDRALDFYVGVLGLREIAREAGAVYLGCGLDGRFDVLLRAGGTGVGHFALRADGDDGLERQARALAAHGVPFERRTASEPGQRQAVRFELPSGHAAEWVAVDPLPYPRVFAPARQRRHGIAPLDLDHINLMAGDVGRVTRFCQQVLGLRLSDATRPEPGHWTASWLRAGLLHHDVAFFHTASADEGLHHLAWTMSGFEHLKVAADMLAAAGIRLELGPSRHPVGHNLFVYFWEPGGNRVELSAEAALLDPDTPPGDWTSMDETLDAWGAQVVPASFGRGS